jgi:DNA-binding GntR family transcriptional regulator
MQSAAIDRRNLSHGLEDRLRDMVVRGTLPEGRINEVHLSRALGASRTPLREALTRLTGEAFLTAQPGHGFYVPPLSAAEVLELYPIRAKLDPWALELAGVPPKADLAELDALNAQIVAAAREPARVIELDDAWHLALVRRCNNPTLVGLIQQMMWRTRRYEFAFFTQPRVARAAVVAHEAILASLRRRDLATACRRLAENMTSAIPALVEKLGARAASGGGAS